MMWNRDDDDLTLYLHIYENALFCSLIWLIAGRNYKNGYYSINWKVKYVTVYILTVEPRLCHHKERVIGFPVMSRHENQNNNIHTVYSIVHFCNDTWPYKDVVGFIGKIPALLCKFCCFTSVWLKVLFFTPRQRTRGWLWGNPSMLSVETKQSPL